MAAALDPRLGKKEFHNWLKGAMSVLFAKEGLSEFVQTEITDFHKDLINSVITQNGIPPGTTCASCTTANVLTCPTTNFCSKGRRCNKHDKTVPGKKPNIQCLNNLCNGLRDGIRNMHRYNQPSWKNSDATKWCANAFEVAKCFMPPEGYSVKSSLADTDFNGMISLIINNKRFQNKMTTQLNTQHNTCSKARDIVNETIRHSGRNELSDFQLAQCIDALRDVLIDSKFLLHDQHAQEAVERLNHLQNNTLIITAGDITRALEDTIRDCLSQQQQEAVQAIKKYLDTAQTSSVAALEFIKSAALDEIKKTADDKKQELMQLSHQQENDDVLLNEFKKELLHFYDEKESMIPASPLVEDFAVPLMRLYVQPPISAITTNAFGQDNSSLIKWPVPSYRKLFFDNYNVPYKNIYVEANAGYGKTSFTQKVAMTWCLAQNPNKLKISKQQQEDVDTLKRFDLLFLLHLRNLYGDDTCLLDDLILKFVSKNLPRKERFSKEFIGRMLQNKTCLVILDGLDEWVHPETCSQTPGIPHNNYRERCTQLTTTRPWKLSTIGLTPNLIDRHIEISALDKNTSEKLKSNAVKLLSETSGKVEPDLNDFDRKVSSVKLGDIRLIPYILLQLICVWFDGISIGKSKCETYSNTIELTLQRGCKKKNTPTITTGNAERNITVPNCIKDNTLCNRYVNILLKLGKLAFYALFQNIKESSLVIESTAVMTFLTQQELEFCLKIGLLSQTMDCSKVSIKRFKVFFQHKSVQEFMAAFYITSEWNNETIKLTIAQVCSSLPSILEMENLFVFVCGMNPEVYTCISGELQQIVYHYCSKMDSLPQYRTFYARKPSDDGMRSYQSMQVQCFQESLKNCNDNTCIPLHKILLPQESGITLTEDDFTDLVTIIHFYKVEVKSLVHTPSEDKTIGLQALYLNIITLAHSNMEHLYAVISQTTTLTELRLVTIDCSDHEIQFRDCDVTMDLHRLNELKMLHLYNVPCRELHVNPACLETLVFRPRGNKMNAIASAAFWQDLRGAPVLSSLFLWNMTSCQKMIETIHTLTWLQYLQLAWIDMDNVIPHFSPAMTNLERVELHAVKMSSASWKELFLNVGQLPRSITVKLSFISMTAHEWRELLIMFGSLLHPVKVVFWRCNGPSLWEWETIVNLIKSTSTLSLLQDLSIDKWLGDDFASLTLKTQ